MSTVASTQEYAATAPESARAATFPSPRLYNDDIAPVEKHGRHWNAYNVFTLWANDVHSLGNYVFALGLFALGLGAWQILVTFAIGASALFVLLTLSAMVGVKTGLPFPVVSRISLGIHGGRIAAIFRGVVAIGWFGIQTYLASNVLGSLLVTLEPSMAALANASFLGLTQLGWICFAILWIVQVVIVRYGLAMIRRYVAFAGPLVVATMGFLAGWALVHSNFTIAWSTSQPLTGADMWGMIFAGACLWVVIYGTFALNVCDFTRCVSKPRSVVIGNFAGILVNMMFFAVIVVILSGSQFYMNGQVITSPSDIVDIIGPTPPRIAISVALIVLTIAVNLVANFVAPIYMLADLWPRVFNFRRAGVVVAIIGVVILPWNLYESPAAITFFLGTLGALLGPFFGMIMVDYWIVRRQRVNIPELYNSAPGGTYYYHHGINWRSVYALAPAVLIAVGLSVAPIEASKFSWLIGAFIAGALQWYLAPRNATYRDVDGEAIARPSR